MKLENCKPGVRVKYFPTLGAEPGFVGVVRENPWQLGDGTWVTHLHQMEKAYREGQRSTVHAAHVLSLEEIPQEAESPPQPTTVLHLSDLQHKAPPHHRTLTLEQWHQEGEAKFGPDEHKWCFVCPSCGHVQKVEDFKPFKDAGANSETAFRNCIGRYDGHMHVTMFTRPGPCNYTSGGLFNLNPVTVTTPEGKNIRVFEFAPAAAPAAESAGAK